MKNLLSKTVLFIFLSQSSYASVTKVVGDIDLAQSTTVQAAKYDFSVETVPEEGTSALKVWKHGLPSTLEFQFISEPGEVFLESVQIESLEKKAGNLLFVYWGRGASAIWLTVVGIKSDGKVGIVFESSCHGGYRILDAIGDGSRQIVEVVEGYAAKIFTTNIYAYSSKGIIELVKTEKVKKPHLYALRSE